MGAFAFLANSSVYILKFHKESVYYTSYRLIELMGLITKSFSKFAG